MSKPLPGTDRRPLGLLITRNRGSIAIISILLPFLLPQLIQAVMHTECDQLEIPNGIRSRNEMLIKDHIIS